ncbi:hypothetical protein [Pseudonocardia sp. HH130630-07]|uniref:hypothetical protein n=1 Tax=Pseudonocardia sp. HH130630-07 TaxID=1690815 RepID=UPI000814C1CC|nr:hypothetical protein [Pseudonocardia sp. HH130630-07]ANY06374.1 hypothetical protein AFB00_08805 [Pseudonocardia sp. HH130630-07]
MGLLASMVNASRLVVVWEQADLQVALQRPGPALPSGLVVLDAPRDGEHVVRWRPMGLVQTGTRSDGLPVVAAQWERGHDVAGGRLPEPISGLLELWRHRRSWSGEEMAALYSAMEDGGYLVSWAQRPDDGPLQRWPQWRHVIAAILHERGQARSSA